MHEEVENREDFQANKIAAYKNGVLITDFKNRKVWQYIPNSCDNQLQHFAGSGVHIHKEGVALDASFCKPCGIAVEFDHVVYITDMSMPIE